MLNMNKRVKNTIAILISFMFIIACDNKVQDEIKEKPSVKSVQAGKIQIVQNKNPQAIKVKEKNITKSKNDNYYFNYGVKSKYDENSQPANKDASVRVKPRTKIDANLHVRSPYEKVQISMLVGKLSKKFIVKCSACHNDYANGIIGPSLLNKSSKDILKSINDFKTGVKKNPLMNDLINLMSNEEIIKIANEIYEFNKQINKLKEK